MKEYRKFFKFGNPDKNSPNKPNKMEIQKPKGVFNLIFVFILIILSLGLISAGNLSLFLNPGINEAGNQILYTFNFSSTNDCSPSNIILNYSKIVQIDTRGVGFVSIDISNLTQMPLALCEFKEGTYILRKNHSFSDIVFNQIYAVNLNLSGDAIIKGSVNVTGNITSNYGFFSYLGSLVDRITKGWFVDIDVSNNLIVNGNLTVDTNTLFVDSNTNRVGIGTITPISPLEIQSLAASMRQTRYSDIDIQSAGITVQRSGGTTVGTDVVVQDDWRIANFNLRGYDGAAYVSAATIEAWIDGTPGIGDMPGRLVFSTTADNANSVTERMRITSDGKVGIGTATPKNTLNIVGEFNVTENATFGADVIIGGTIFGGSASRISGGLDITGDLNVTGTSYLGSIIIDADNITLNDLISKDGNISFFNSTNAEIVRFVDNGRVGIGTLSPDNVLTVSGDTNIADTFGLIVGHSSQIDFGATPEFQILGTGVADSSMGFAIFKNSATGAPDFRFLKSRGTTIGSNVLVQDGDRLGRIRFHGADGGDFNTAAAEFLVEVDGTASLNNVYGRFIWKTRSSGGLNEKMRLTKEGNLGIGTENPKNTLNVIGDGNFTGNLNLGQKITFTFGEIIDNIINGWIRVTGNLNVTGDTEVGGNLNVTGDINLGGIKISKLNFDPIVGFTNGSYNGNITNGSLFGYVAANNICNVEYPGSHFCTKDEVLKTIAYGNYSYSGTAWLQNGPPGDLANANDCTGWTDDDNTFVAPYWNWDENSLAGAGFLTNCAQTKQLMCCGII